METTTIPSYKEGLAQLTVNLAQMLPPEVVTAFDSYAKEMQGTMPEILRVKVGDKAPNFTLTNHLGNAISLSNLLKSGKVILVFYRGAWCPYCNLQLNQLQSILGEIESSNARLIAISPQTPDSSLSMAEKNNLKFEVLSDVGNAVAKKFTTVFRHADKATNVVKSLGIDFEGHYGDDSHEIPVPTVFVIDKNGTVKFAKSEGGDYRNRVEASQILAALN